jgi:hypothetical protein
MLRVSSPAGRADSKLRVIPVRMYTYSLLLSMVQMEQRISNKIQLNSPVSYRYVEVPGNTGVLPAHTNNFVTNNKILSTIFTVAHI